MAVLSVPSNTPTVDGATAVCVSDDATGTVYLSVRTDRAWYSLANGDSQELVDEDKAMIISGATDAPVVWSGNQAASLDPEQLIDGLDARLDPEAPYYVGWVQEQSSDITAPVITAVSHNTPGETTATITWTTDEPATSSVEYGETAGLGTTEPATPDATLRTSHSVALSDLTSGTLHYYDVTSVDAAANSATESGTPFTTVSSNPYGDKMAVEFLIPADLSLTLPFFGTPTGTIDWGDGDQEALNATSMQHDYAAEGLVTVTLDSTYANLFFNNGGDKDKVEQVYNLGTCATTYDGAFYGCINLKTVNSTTGPASIDRLRNVFRGCESLTQCDISSINDVTGVFMNGAFYGCSSLTSLNLGTFDLRNAGWLSEVFRGCTALRSVDITNWAPTAPEQLVGFARNCPDIDMNISLMNYGSVVSWGDFFSSSKLSTAQYDAFLIAAQSQTLPAQLLSMGTTTYTLSAQSARNAVELMVGTISDGGLEP